MFIGRFDCVGTGVSLISRGQDERERVFDVIFAQDVIRIARQRLSVLEPFTITQLILNLQLNFVINLPFDLRIWLTSNAHLQFQFLALLHS